ncbi:MAG: translation initiation factor IF-2 N-terminal domain-containing protein, partial [Coraliomargaritaceae bacterium]
MSVRIHQLSKQIGIENKELIELLRSRGFEVKSSS